MRLTASNPPEKGFKYTGGERYRVSMDGKPVMRVLRVDTVQGVAWVAAGVMDNRIVERRIYGPMKVERVDQQTPRSI